MPLFPPRLDTLRWDDLVKQGRAQLPLVAPSWTDQNTSDPGIAALELLSWLIESQGFRSSATTDRERLLLLALAGYTPHAAQPSTCLVRFSVPAGTSLPVTVPAGLELMGVRDDETLPLTVLDDVVVSGSTITTVANTSQEAETSSYRSGCTDVTAALAAGRSIPTFGTDPAEGDALLLGLAPAEVALQAGPVDLWFVTTGGLAAPERASAPHHSARSAWELWDGGSWVTIDDVEDASEGVRSGRVRLTLPVDVPSVMIGDQVDGVLAGRAASWLRCRLTGGRYDAAPSLEGAYVDVAPVLVAQTYSSTLHVGPGASVTGTPTPGSPFDEAAIAVAINDDRQVTSIRFDPPTASDAAPIANVSLWIPPAGGVPGRLSTDIVLLGTASGFPDETFLLPQRACYPLPQLWVVGTDGRSRSVRMLRDLAEAGPGDLAAHLAEDAATIRFGDGRTGQTLEPGSTVMATGWYTVDAGLSDVRPPMLLSVPVDDRSRRLLGANAGILDAHLVDALHIGTEAEDITEVAARAERALWVHDRLAEALRRVRAMSLDELPLATVRLLDVPERAVTAADMERIALATPGTALWRARALPWVDPRLPGLRADGCITVVVVPHLPVARPEPTPGLLAAVRVQLEGMRTLGTRIFVVGPEYVAIGVSARLVLMPGAPGADVIEAATQAVRSFLHPVTGGPTGRGWPFGRTVRRTEVLQVLDSVPGVDRVDGLELRREPGMGNCDDVTICPTQLVLAASVVLDPVTAGGPR
ncbi:MAG: hypothetical protein ABWX92_14195 [Mycetocola sp.]